MSTSDGLSHNVLLNRRSDSHHRIHSCISSQCRLGLEPSGQAVQRFGVQGMDEYVQEAMSARALLDHRRETTDVSLWRGVITIGVCQAHCPEQHTCCVALTLTSGNISPSSKSVCCTSLVSFSLVAVVPSLSISSQGSDSRRLWPSRADASRSSKHLSIHYGVYASDSAQHG